MAASTLETTMKFRTLEYDPRKNLLIILDQTKLPIHESYVRLKTAAEIIKAIQQLKVRGAPLIGVFAAYAVAMAAKKGGIRGVNSAIRSIGRTRPTAVNLSWALERMRRRSLLAGDLYAELLHEARLIEKEDKRSCLAIGRLGAPLVPPSGKVMVYCNAGALATSGIGTALGILYTAKRQAKRFEVFACETRPLLQGSRLTSWELSRHRIRVRVISDNMAAHFMPQMSLVLIGADRVAGNGDTANKIGSKGLAIIARTYGVPFYVAAPRSSFDLRIKAGSSIEIEERGRDEVAFFNGKCIVDYRAKVSNPAFDVTPHRWINGFITEYGIIRPPFERNIVRILNRTIPDIDCRPATLTRACY